MRSFKALASILVAITVAVASPVPNELDTDLQKRAPDCKAANVALTVLKALSPPGDSLLQLVPSHPGDRHKCNHGHNAYFVHRTAFF